MFKLAKPVFPDLSGNEKNRLATFRAKCDLRGAGIKIAAADFYRVYVNGKFLSFGPARTAKGYARVDVLDPTPLATGDDELVIAVVGYRCPYTISLINQPAFLCAEVEKDGEILLCTGRDFSAHLLSCKLQKTERYSTQRQFAEVWDLRRGDILSESCPETAALPLENPPKLIDRRAPYPLFEDIDFTSCSSRGALNYDPALPVNRNFYSEKINENFGIFSDDEIEYRPYLWLQSQNQTKTGGKESFPVTLCAGQYAIIDLSRIEVGFINFSADVKSECDLVIGYTEDASPEKFEFTDMHAHTAAEFILPAGNAEASTFEPYSVRYAIVAVKSGELTLKRFGIKTYINAMPSVSVPKLGDPELELIYRAALRSYAHNAVDLYTDCPSRERAGWLCDTYFTSQTEYFLFGSTAVEDAFLENYRLYKNEGEIPAGMIPMCYPSSQLFLVQGDKYIPQWAMWYIIEVDDYINRRGHRDLAEAFRASLYGLLGFFAQYENKDGLLENLPNWNFIEWGIANSWTAGISYPTNFLYARVLDAFYNVYGDEKCRDKAVAVRAKTVEASFNGSYFLDHSVRDENGKPILQPEASEAEQYYALLFGELDLSDEKYSEFLRLIKEVFNPKRDGATEMPEIAPVDLFIGAYLRIEALLKLEEWELVLRDVKGFFGGMAHDTETLWEYRRRHGSRNHGFASFAAVAIDKAIKNI